MTLSLLNRIWLVVKFNFWPPLKALGIPNDPTYGLTLYANSVTDLFRKRGGVAAVAVAREKERGFVNCRVVWAASLQTEASSWMIDLPFLKSFHPHKNDL